MKKFPLHNPHHIEYVQQRLKTDCGVACFAMITGKLYLDAKIIIGRVRGGIYPDDLLEILDDFGYYYKEVKSLPKNGIALVAIQWKKPNLSGHYIIWDSERSQFLDPINGLIDQNEMLKFATIDYIWKIK